MPTIAIQPATAPVDAPFPPASAQAMLNFVAAYLQIAGLENLTGVIVGKDEPAAADRDKAWIKIDAATLRPLGFWAFTGGYWTPMPIVAPSGTAPNSPRKGELFFNSLNGLQIYDGSNWTTNLFPMGATADRPKDAQVDDLFYDTEISRLLKNTTRGWSTFDGSVGEIRIFDAADISDALTRNPGWSEFTALANKFPLGQSSNHSPQNEGGVALEQMNLKWAAKGRSANSSARNADATFISALTLNGVEKMADGNKWDGQTSIGSEQTIDLTPPYKAMIFLKKDY